MKSVSSLLGVLVLLLLGGLTYQHFRIAKLEAQLAGVLAEREAQEKEIKRLAQRTATPAAVPPLTVRSQVVASDPPPAARGRGPQAQAATPARVLPPERPGVTRTAPVGWTQNSPKPESYISGVDSTETWGGMPSAYVESLTPTVDKGFGGMMQTTSAANYAGQRVRLSGWIKTADANEGGGHLWMRIDGQRGAESLAFDNMDNRPVKGTTDWQEASVVLDVPAGATSLNYGFFVAGGGKMWVNGQRIEVVGQDVPTTDMLSKRPPLPEAPRNLGFEPTK